MIVPGLLSIAQRIVTGLERATTPELAATSALYHASVRALPRSIAVLLAVLAGQNPDRELTAADLELAAGYAGAMLSQIREDALKEHIRLARVAEADRLGSSRLLARALTEAEQ